MGRVEVLDMYFSTAIMTSLTTLALIEFCVAKDAVDNGNLKFAEVFFTHLPTLPIISMVQTKIIPMLVPIWGLQVLSTSFSCLWSGFSKRKVIAILRFLSVIAIFKFAVTDLRPAKYGIEDGLTMAEAIVLKEKTFHMWLFQIPVTILAIMDQYCVGNEYLVWQENRVMKASVGKAPEGMKTD